MIDSATAEKLLYLGIIVIIAAIAGGGLDAANVITVPQLRDWRTQAAVAALGAGVMVIAIIGLAQAVNTVSRSAWETKMTKLAQGTEGIPAPALPPDIIRYDLIELLNQAGDDYDENCAVAAFVLEFSDRLDRVPDAVKAKMVNPLPTSSTVCYKESLQVAQHLQTKAAAPKRSVLSPVGENVRPALLVAARDTKMTISLLREFRSGNYDAHQIAATSATRILESATAVGDEGYIYLGQTGIGGFADDRTIQERSAAVGTIVTVRTLINLRVAGTDTDYGNHTVSRVFSPGTRVIIKSLNRHSDGYQWALVRVVSLP